MMKRLPLSPRLRLLCVLIAAPIVYILFFASAQPKRPAFDPYDDGLEDSYQRHSSHVIEEDDDEGWNFVPKLDNLKGLGSGLGLGKRELVLVTGGAGQLGQAILPRLLENYDVHILDIAPRPADLPSSVTYHRGSAANPSTIGGVIKSESFAGVIHFAGVSLDAWCSARPLECQNINEGSAREVARAVAIQAQKVGSSWRGGSVPWLIMGSSTEVYGYSADKKIDEESATVPNSHLGKTLLAAEQAFTGSFRSNMRGIILRFSDVYGYPPTTAIEEGQIPTLVRNALSSLTVQFDSDSEPQDMVYVDDAVDAVMRAVDHVKGLAGDVERFNVVAGPRWAIEDIVERTRTITSSLSPFVDIGDHRSFFTASEFGGAKANSVLDWTPSVALPAGLQKTISTYTKAQHAWTYGYIEDQCPSSRLLPADHVPKRNQADERNKALHNLDKCLVSLAFDHKGFLNHMKCEDGRTCHADGDYVSGYNWNSTYFIVHARKGEQERQARLMFEEEKGMGFLGMPVGLKQDEGTVWTLTEADSDEYTTDFDVEAASDSSMLTVSIPGSGSLNALSNNTDQSTFFALSPKPKFDMRMTVVCCPREGEWPLLLDDFESSDMRFGSTAQIPFNASRRSATCSRAEVAHDYTYELLKRYDSDADPNAAEYPAADLVARIPTGALDMTHKPHNWTLRELPTCWNDCNSPLVCVSTGACRCINAECPARRDNPLFTLRAAERRKAQLDADRREAQIQKSWEHAHAEEESHLGSQLGVHAFEAVKDKHLLKILVDDVAKLDMTDVLLPQARAYIAKHPDFIKVFVVDDTVGQDEIEKAECHKLQDRHCFSADHILYEGFRSIQVKTPEEADLLVLPVYQQCKGVEFTIHDVQANARDNITGVREVDKRVSAVLTHDWGICIQFAWEIWSARKVLYPDWIVDNTLVFSVMGDYDSPCYRPHQDVVIPARSCRSNLLRETFPTIDKIRPMRQRPNLMTWAGTYWGTGKNDRLRLTCPRGGANLRELIKGSGPQDNWESWDYMNDLSNARFCPQPRGIAGWSPRTNDAIFAGCIPVLIAEGSHYPYANFLDWSKFSVRVQPTDLDRIEQILAGIPLEKVEEMQANLALIREGFLYSSDQNPQEEKVRKGPMWFALHEAGMRLRTRYPLIKDEGK